MGRKTSAAAPGLLFFLILIFLFAKMPAGADWSYDYKVCTAVNYPACFSSEAPAMEPKAGALAADGISNASGTDNVSGIDSIRSIRLPENYPDAWDSAWWNGNGLVSDNPIFGQVYNTSLHASTTAFGTDVWDGSADDSLSCMPAENSGGLAGAQAGMASAQKQRALAKDYYRNETEAYRSVETWKNLLVPENWLEQERGNFTSISIPPPILSAYALDPLGAAVSYGTREGRQDIVKWLMKDGYISAWKNSMRASAKAAGLSAKAINEAMDRAQAQADALKAMGAMEADYDGKAQEAYLDWQVFVSQSARWSNSAIDEKESWPSESAKAYGKTRQALLLLQQQVSQTGWTGPPLYQLRNQLPYAMNIMAGPCAQRTLWAVAWQHEENLTKAMQQMKEEVGQFRARALDAQDAGTASLKQMDGNDPPEFSKTYPRQGALQNTALAVEVGGTIPQRAEKIHAMMDGARTLLEQGNGANGDLKASWAARAMRAYERAGKNYTQARQLADGLSGQMQQTRAQARDDAQALIGSLDEKLGSASADPSAGSVLMGSSASQFLAQAKAEWDRGEAVQNSDGKAYSHYAQAAALASQGLAALNDPQGAQTKADLLSVLEEYRSLLDRSAGLLGTDYAQMLGRYQYYKSLAQNPSAQTLAGARQALEDLKALLRNKMDGQKARYEGLAQNVSALAGFDDSMGGKFNSDFAKYWQSGWTDEAPKEWSNVNALLDRWEKAVSEAYPRAVNASLCNGAQWQSNLQIPQPAGTRQDVGGRWIGGPSPLFYAQSVQVSCPLAIPFLPSDATHASSNVQTAMAAGKKISLTLSGIDPADSTWAEFSSIQIPFRILRDWCQTDVDAKGMAQYDANFSLVADFPVKDLPLFVDWSEGADGKASLQMDGQSVDGQFVQRPDAQGGESKGALKFILPWVKDGTVPLQVHAEQSTPVRLERNGLQAVAQNNGSLAVSYQLDAGGLPPCNQLKVRMPDEYGNARPLLSGLDGKKIRWVDSDSGAGGWMVAGSGEDFTTASWRVSYDVQDADAWMAQASGGLEARARSLNDSQALDMMAKARAMAANGNYKDAGALLETVRRRLDAQGADGGADLKNWQEEEQKAQTLIARLQNVFKNDESDNSPKWLKDLPGWISSLSNALQKAREQEAGGNLGAARTLWRDADGAVLLKARAGAKDDFDALALRLQGLSVLSKRPELADETANLSIESLALADARNNLTADDLAGALESLENARAGLDGREDGALQKAQKQMEALNAQARLLAADALALQSRLEDYSKAWSGPQANALSSIRPRLGVSQAKDMASAMQKVASLQAPAAGAPKSYSDAWAQADAQAKKISDANKSYSDAKAAFEDAQNALQGAARTSAREAEVRVQNALAAGAPADESDALKADLARMQQALDSSDWMEAGALAENIIARAKKLEQSPPQPPYALMAISLALMAAIAYVLLVKKNGEDGKPKSAGHTPLAKAGNEKAGTEMEKMDAPDKTGAEKSKTGPPANQPVRMPAKSAKAGE